jgi:hypothetical protein
VSDFSPIDEVVCAAEEQCGGEKEERKQRRFVVIRSGERRWIAKPQVMLVPQHATAQGSTRRHGTPEPVSKTNARGVNSRMSELHGSLRQNALLLRQRLRRVVEEGRSHHSNLVSLSGLPDFLWRARPQTRNRRPSRNPHHVFSIGRT